MFNKLVRADTAELQKVTENKFFKDGVLSHEDKQDNIRSIVREIQIFGTESGF